MHKLTFVKFVSSRCSFLHSSQLVLRLTRCCRLCALRLATHVISHFSLGQLRGECRKVSGVAGAR